MLCHSCNAKTQDILPNYKFIYKTITIYHNIVIGYISFVGSGAIIEAIKDGDYIGWNVDKGLVELDFDACITDTDEPCIVIDYNIMPYNDYNRYM